MEYFCYSLAILAVLYVSGLGFTLWILPESLRRYTLIIAPWIGYCYAVLACWPVFYCGGHISRHTARTILIAPILCLITELVRKRHAKVGRTILHAPTLGALALAAAGFAVVSIPVFWPSGRATTVSLGNNDIATYGVMIRYLSEFTRHSTEGFVGQLAASPLPLEWVTKDYYFGPPAFGAFVGKSLGLMPHQELSLCVFLLSALGAAIIFLILDDTLRSNLGAALSGVAFVIFHPMIQYIALEGFFPQVVGVGLALLLFWTNTKLFDKNRARLDKAKLWLLLTLFTGALLLSYPHMLPFVWFLIAGYVIVLALLEKSVQRIRICVVANILALFVTAAVFPQRVKPFLDIFRLYASVESGWFIPWMAPDYLVGLMYKNPFLEVTSDWHARLGLSLFIALAFVLAMWIAYRNGFRRVVALGFACVAIYSGCFLLAVIGRKDGILGGYKSFKLVVFFLPFFGVVFVSLLALLRSRYRRIDLAIKLIVVMAVITGYAMADNIMLRPTRFARVEPEYEVLLGLERTKSVNSINVLSGVYWPTLWASYFLMHKKLYLAHESYFITSNLVGEYDLEDEVNSHSDIVHVEPIEKPVVSVLNKRFTLIGPVMRRVRAKLGVGWYLGEIGHAWSGKDGKRSSIILHAGDEGTRVSLRFVCTPLRGTDRLMLQADGEKLGASVDALSNGQERISVSNLVLKKGDTEVDIISELEPTQPNATDPRPVSYCFSSVEVEEL